MTIAASLSPLANSDVSAVARESSANGTRMSERAKSSTVIFLISFIISPPMIKQIVQSFLPFRLCDRVWESAREIRKSPTNVLRFIIAQVFIPVQKNFAN